MLTALVVLFLVIIVRRVVRAICAIATSNLLLLGRNHFVHGGAVPVTRVASVQGIRSVGFKDFSMAGCLLVRCKGKGCTSMLPIGRGRFVRLVRGAEGLV